MNPFLIVLVALGVPVSSLVSRVSPYIPWQLGQKRMWEAGSWKTSNKGGGWAIGEVGDRAAVWRRKGKRRKFGERNGKWDWEIGSTSTTVEQLGDGTGDNAFEELEGRHPHPCIFHNTLNRLTPYAICWEWQKQLLDQRASSPEDYMDPDVVLAVQHEPVFTLGTGSTAANLKFSPDDSPFELFRTERGGEVTYHGPGQIVLYPIVNLRRYRKDIHWYLRALEETVIRTLAKLGLQGERMKGMTGVWVQGHKVAAIGVRVKRWITMHGLAINVDPEMQDFQHIIPCGISDYPVGSLRNLCSPGTDIGMERVNSLLLKSFEEVFGVEFTILTDIDPL
ncbi:unnamed protein product [Choristocarpus tenellus]